MIEHTIENYNLINVLNTSFKAESKASCEKYMQWSFGEQFMKYLRISKYNGLSGLVEFDDSSGLRDKLKFYIYDKLKDSIDLIGSWTESKMNKRIHITREFFKEREASIKKLNRNLLVAAVIVDKSLIFFLILFSFHFETD